MRKFILTSLFILFQANSTFAFVFDKSFILQKDTNLMVVLLYDDASDGCWTNLLESKQFAEDKLKLRGVNISSDPDIVLAISEKRYKLGIHVHARRFSGYCSGNVSIFIEGYALINGKLHKASIYEEQYLTIQLKNLNNDVLDSISKAFQVLK